MHIHFKYEITYQIIIHCFIHAHIYVCMYVCTYNYVIYKYFWYQKIPRDKDIYIGHMGDTLGGLHIFEGKRKPYGSLILRPLVTELVTRSTLEMSHRVTLISVYSCYAHRGLLEFRRALAILPPFQMYSWQAIYSGGWQKVSQPEKSPMGWLYLISASFALTECNKRNTACNMGTRI